MLSESDTRAKLIDPALHARGWTEDLIRREETAGAIEIVGEQARKQARGRIDYTLRVRVYPGTQPVAMALIEAKAEHLPPDHGLEQAKAYGACKRLNVRFCFASNGHLFVEYDHQTGRTSAPAAIAEFPSPGDLRRQWEEGAGFTVDSAGWPTAARSVPGRRGAAQVLPGRGDPRRSQEARSEREAGPLVLGDGLREDVHCGATLEAIPAALLRRAFRGEL